MSIEHDRRSHLTTTKLDWDRFQECDWTRRDEAIGLISMHRWFAPPDRSRTRRRNSDYSTDGIRRRDRNDSESTCRGRRIHRIDSDWNGHERISRLTWKMSDIGDPYRNNTNASDKYCRAAMIWTRRETTGDILVSLYTTHRALLSWLQWSINTLPLPLFRCPNIGVDDGWLIASMLWSTFSQLKIIDVQPGVIVELPTSWFAVSSVRLF